MHRRRRSNNDASNVPHHPSANEIDEEQNMEQDAAYYDDRQSPNYHHHHSYHDDDDDDTEHANLQRAEPPTNHPVVRAEQEIRSAGGRPNWPAGAASRRAGYSGARAVSSGRAQVGPSQQQQQQQQRTTLEVHAQHDLPPGEDTEELTEPLLQQASPGRQCAPHGSLKEASKHQPATVTAVVAASSSTAPQEQTASKAPTAPPTTTKLSPSSSISSSSLSSKTSKASKTSNRHRLRKSRSKDAQTEIEHPKAPLVVAEDSEDLDGEEDDEEEVEEERKKGEGMAESPNNSNSAATYRGEDQRTLKSSGSSSRSTIVPRGR
uniref:Uncharacterized protein n=1 Tax=Anopheles melas TaxID=34690 RepID=A0A182TNU0_9DIPT